MNKIRLAFLGLAVSAVFALPGYADTTATVTCKDGSTSTTTGKGACSHHGGVQKGTTSATASTAASGSSASAPSSSATSSSTGSAAAAPAKSTSSSAAAPAKSSTSSTASASSDKGPATAKCKDGTMSYAKHHEGACSHHGGVAEFLDSK